MAEAPLYSWLNEAMTFIGSWFAHCPAQIDIEMRNATSKAVALAMVFNQRAICDAVRLSCPYGSITQAVSDA